MRHLLTFIFCIAMSGCGSLFDYVGGNFTRGPLKPIKQALSPEAQRLVKTAFEGIDKPVDHHNHLIGLKDGNYVNPAMMNWWNPGGYFRYRIFLSATGITNLDLADEQYVERLVNLIRATPKHGKHLIYGMDKFHLENGQADLEQTTFHIPNDYVVKIAERYPDCFIPVVSIHPYRPDAVEAVNRWAAKGVKYIKWLPNSMNIDPSLETITPFYQAMIRHKMVLLTHAGSESAVQAHGTQHLGNPLLLRRPLDLGVTVVVLHCASDGDGDDLDNPGKTRSNFRLFLRLMDEYPENLYGEISAIVVFNRMNYLDNLLARPDLHSRLINGSDYPIPAINVVVWTGRMRRLGLITEAEEKALDEIYKYNPLLFDFVLKRTVRHPTKGTKFAPSVFQSPFD